MRQPRAVDEEARLPFVRRPMMMRVVLIAAVLFLPITARAENNPPALSERSESNGPALSPSTIARGSLSNVEGRERSESNGEGIISTLNATLFDAPVAQAPAQTRPPVPRGTGSTRRPSMVGYIEDSTIGSRIRVRFDAAQHLHAPDRAEFFYAKCGWYNGLPVSSPMYDPDAPGPLGGIATDLNAQQLFVLGEY